MLRCRLVEWRLRRRSSTAAVCVAQLKLLSDHTRFAVVRELISNSYDADNWNVSLSGINYTSGTAAIVMGVSDGQGWTDADVKLNASTLAAGPQVFPGALTGGNGDFLNGTLWDINTYDITSYLSPGSNDLDLFTSVDSDCLSLIHVMIDLPAGAAPPDPNPVPEPSTVIGGLAFAGLAGARLLRRKTAAK